MNRNVSIDCSVYGGQDGAVAFLDTPDGVIPPPYIAHMTYLGPPCDVVTTVVNGLHAAQKAAEPHRKARPQQALAEMLGVVQQDVSRWINARCAPRLDDDRWAILIRLYLMHRPVLAA